MLVVRVRRAVEVKMRSCAFARVVAFAGGRVRGAWRWVVVWVGFGRCRSSGVEGRELVRSVRWGRSS
jgi:hypothetical protein